MLAQWLRGDPAQEFLRATEGAVDLVHNLARRLTDGHADAEDLVQETFLLAWRGWLSGTRPHRIEPWLATICLNAARDRARRAARRPERPVAEPDPGRDVLVDVERAALDRVLVAEVETALAQLPLAQREAVVLADVCGLTAREVAEATGVPLGTALSRIHRGRRAVVLLLSTVDSTVDSIGNSPAEGGVRDAALPTDHGRPVHGR